MCKREAASCPDTKNHGNCVSSLRVTTRRHNGDVAMANSFVQIQVDSKRQTQFRTVFTVQLSPSFGISLYNIL